MAAHARQPDPFPAVAPARLEAVFLHAPEVECIGKGKVSAPYEFGVKASIATTNARAPGGQFVLHAKTLPGNPYDGHTLGVVIEDTERLTGCEIERAYVDPRRVFISGRLRRHQARTATPLRHRGRDRTHEDRPSPRPLPSQGPPRRCRQRHPHRRRSQPPTRPGLAQDSPSPNRAPAPAGFRTPVRIQLGFVTDNTVAIPNSSLATPFPIVGLEIGLIR